MPLSKTQDLVGRGVISKIYANKAILDSRLALKGAVGGLAAMIPPGMRAVAVGVNEVVGVAGFAVPGMHVDVIISGTPPSGSGGVGTLTTTLLQDIEVLSAGQDCQKDAEGKPVAVRVVNLLVTPEHAEELSLASHQTSIQLALRNPLNRDVTETSGVAQFQLFGGEKPNPVEPPKPPARLRRRRPVPPAAAEVALSPPPPPPVKKEEPFTMEFLLGPKKIETTFETR